MTEHAETVTGAGDAFYSWAGLSPVEANIPAALCAVDQWVLWKATPKPAGGMNKIPYQPNGKPAKSNDPNTWTAFIDCWLGYEEDPDSYAGVGFVLSKEDGFVAVDLDHCRNADTGELTVQAQRIVGALGTYAEVSPSGTGILIMGYAEHPVTAKGNGIEVYSHGRYVTITGQRLDDAEAEIKTIPPARLERLSELAKGKKEQPKTNGADDPVVAALKAAGLYQRQLEQGRHAISCPWLDDHTGGDATGTVYMEAHHNGHERASFVCQHAHCADKRLSDLEVFLELGGATKPWPPSRGALMLNPDELEAARLAPRCIVEKYLYADVAQVIAPGGTGKTTMLIFEAVRIALGGTLWGLAVESPGWVLFVTKEDRREHLAARLREIMREVELPPDAQQKVREAVIFLDVTGSDRKLAYVADGNIRLTEMADKIIEAYTDDPPAMVVFDPLVSFGASEGMVNDNEQALVEAARRIIRGLDCCVRYIHHTGKANARAATTDQYSGRGGTALPDGSRMTTVLEAWDANQKEIPPAGCTPGNTSSVFKIHRHKLSYAPPNQPTIWIKRDGFAFEHFLELRQTPEQQATAQQTQLERFLESRINAGEFHTPNTLDEVYSTIQMTRKEGRAALAILQAQGRVVDMPLPKERRHGRKQSFVCPVNLAADYGGLGEK